MTLPPPHLEIEAPFAPGRKVVSGNRNRQSLSLLFGVELRKFFRADGGIAVPLITLAIMAIAVFGGAHGADPENPVNAAGLIVNATDVAAVFLPVIGAMMLAGEFSSKLAITTFTLTPRRGRILLAKYLTGVLFGLVATLVALGLAVALAAIYPYAHARAGSLQLDVLLQTWLLLTLKFSVGIALGSLLLHTAPAVIATFAGPALLAAFLSIQGFGLQALSKWIDLFGAPSPGFHHALSQTQWAHVGTTFGCWLLVPLLLGWRRVKRHDF